MHGLYFRLLQLCHQLQVAADVVAKDMLVKTMAQ